MKYFTKIRGEKEKLVIETLLELCLFGRFFPQNVTCLATSQIQQQFSPSLHFLWYSGHVVPCTFLGLWSFLIQHALTSLRAAWLCPEESWVGVRVCYAWIKILMIKFAVCPFQSRSLLENPSLLIFKGLKYVYSKLSNKRKQNTKDCIYPQRPHQLAIVKV